MVPYRKQFSANEQLAVEMNRQDTAAAKYATLPARLPKVTFVEFKYSGHSRPKEEETNKFFFAIIHKFLQQN